MLAKKKQVKSVFREWDKKGTGRIRKETLVLVWKNLEPSLTDQQISSVMQVPALMMDGNDIFFDKFVDYVFAKASQAMPKPAKGKPIYIDKLKTAFSYFDKDKSGYIGFEEVQALEEFYRIPMQVSASAAEWLDGKIDFDELIGWLKKVGYEVKANDLEANILTVESLRQAYKNFDKDKNGTIGFEEVQAIEQFYNIPMSVSSNAKDWADGKIDFYEFLGWLTKSGMKIADAAPPNDFSIETLKKEYDKFDMDHNGSIGFDEVQAIEQKYNIPMMVSANAKDWKDGRIDFNEFLEWLKKAGHPVVVP